MPVSGDEPAYSGPPCSDEKTAQCARCGSVGPINLFNRGGYHYLDDNRAVFIAICAACEKGTVAVEYGEWIQTQRAGGVRMSWTRKRTETWWPSGSEVRPIDSDVQIPGDALRFWYEANRCMSVRAYNAAAVMLRNVLGAIAIDIGGADVAAERSLDGKLKVLTKGKPQTIFLLDHMDAVKAIGNAGAHPEDWPEVEEIHAETARMVARYLIEVLYEQPQRIAANLLRRNVKT